MTTYRHISQASGDLAKLANALKLAGRGDLRRELLAAIRRAGGPAVEKAQAEARATIPSRGGLADMVANNVSVRSRLSGASASVKVRKKNRIPTDRTMVSIDASGTWRHPVFDPETWVEQSAAGAEGWFTKTIDSEAPQFRVQILRAMSDVAKKLERGL